MSSFISVDHVSKTIRNRTLLSDICVDVNKGNTVGFVGRNGSGKTVLFKCLLGFMYPSSGNIIWDGKCLTGSMNMHGDVGIIIENPGFIASYSGWTNLKLLAQVKNQIGIKEIREAIEAVGLDPDERKPVKTYSLGMRQRLAIAQAIMENPSTLILDEPMNGLDASGVEQMRTLLLEQKKMGKTIILASHIKDDIELLCDKVYHMDGGRILSDLSY